jgi:transcription antitermination factor NusA-like protein
MRLPVCNFDIESDMLCPNCQARFERGEITKFDIEFSKWLLDREKEHPNLENLVVLKAAKAGNRLVLVVKKKNKELLLSEESLLHEMTERFGELIVIEGPAKLRTVVREFISPANEVGVNSLYSPDGTKESIVILREADRERIMYSKEELRFIISAIMNESVLFEFRDDRRRIVKDEETKDEFEQRMKELEDQRSR